MGGIVRPVLLLVLFVSSVMLGSYLAAEDRRRVEALSELGRLIAYIRVSVGYYGAPMAQIFDSFRSAELERIGFLPLLTNWSESSGVFSEALRCCSRQLGLGELTESLIPFGDGLGRLLPEEQTEACLCAEALIAEELGRRRGELPGRMKLHRSVCTALGMMAVLLLTAGVFFTLRTRLLPVRLFRDMIAAVCEKNQSMDSLSSFQTLIVSTATRVGMGNLVGVVAAVSAGGAGAVFWMWVTALLGASTSFVESTLAQKYRQLDPLYGGQRGGPAYYIHVLAERKRGKKLRHSIIAVLFAISGLICWCGISQVISNSVSSAFANAFSIPPIVTTVVLVVLSAVIVLRKDATVKSLDVIVPIMAVCYFVMTVIIIAVNFRQLPAVLGRIFSEAFGLRQVAAGGFGAVLMNGVKRGLFSNEAGSGSAPCAAAAASCDDPVKMGFVQALGVLIDTVVICSCTAFMMLLAPANITTGLTGMDLLQAAAQYHLGSFGVVFIAVTLALFSFSTFIGILFYARSNVAYLFGDRWGWQTAYKVLALVMLMVGGLEAYTVVWDLGDVGIGLMTIFNLIALYPMSGEAIAALRDYERRKHLTQN